VDPDLKRASLLLQRGMFPGSERICRDFLVRRPGDCDALRILAMCRLNLGFPEEAVEGLENAVLLLPGSSMLWRDLGIAYLHCCRDSEAETALQEAVSLAPGWHQPWLELGVALGRLGKTDAAKEAYETVLGLEPGLAEALINLGSLLQRTEHWIEAEACFRQILSSDRNHLDALEQLANCMIRQHRYGDAIAYLHRTVLIEPSRASLWEAMGAAQLGRGAAQLAEAALQRALSLGRNPRILLLLGHAQKSMDRWEASLASYREAAEGQGESFEDAAVRGVVECLLHLGRPNEAALLMIDPQSTEIEEVFSRASALHMLGRREEAGEGYRRVLLSDGSHEGALFLLAALEEGNVSRAPTGYLRSLFQGYAPHYDAHYRDVLHARAAKETAALLRGSDSSFGLAVDVGCGTGMLGEEIRGQIHRLVGIDLSPGMLEQARGKGCYDELVEGDFLDWDAEEGIETVCAIEVLNYFGDLLPVFRTFSSWLLPGGVLALTVEKGDGPWRLQPSGRFSHSLDHVRQRAKQVGFSVAACKEIQLRREGEGWLGGACFLLRKPGKV
jgi:predicted TPR repeat methyltransferase